MYCEDWRENGKDDYEIITITMNNYKEKFQKLSDLEKNAIDQKEQFIKKIIYDYEHLDMELSQEKHKVSNLKLREMEHLEFIDGLRKENERLRKELNLAKGSENLHLTRSEINKIHQIHKVELDEMAVKIKTLQDKLGSKTVLLSTLAEGIKSYAEETSLEKAHDLFDQLNTILIGEKAWVDNAKQLKKYFQELNKKKKPVSTHIEHADQVIGVAEKDSVIIKEKVDKE